MSLNRINNGSLRGSSVYNSRQPSDADCLDPILGERNGDGRSWVVVVVTSESYFSHAI